MSNRFTSKPMLTKVKFMGEDVEIAKLTVAQVMSIQDAAKAIKDGDEEANVELLVKVIGFATPEFKDFSLDDYLSLPMEELSKLSNAIMKHSGLVK